MPRKHKGSTGSTHKNQPLHGKIGPLKIDRFCPWWCPGFLQFFRGTFQVMKRQTPDQVFRVWGFFGASNLDDPFWTTWFFFSPCTFTEKTPSSPKPWLNIYLFNLSVSSWHTHLNRYIYIYPDNDVLEKVSPFKILLFLVSMLIFRSLVYLNRKIWGQAQPMPRVGQGSLLSLKRTTKRLGQNRPFAPKRKPSSSTIC